MNNDVICEKCGALMVPYEKDLTIGMRCEKCEWGWVTTKPYPLSTDETIYSVKISSDYANNKDALSLISHNTPNNFLTAKILLENNEYILSGKAPIIADFLNKCESCDITYTVEPEFPYNI